MLPAIFLVFLNSTPFFPKWGNKVVSWGYIIQNKGDQEFFIHSRCVLNDVWMLLYTFQTVLYLLTDSNQGDRGEHIRPKCGCPRIFMVSFVERYKILRSQVSNLPMVFNRFEGRGRCVHKNQSDTTPFFSRIRVTKNFQIHFL